MPYKHKELLAAYLSAAEGAHPDGLMASSLEATAAKLERGEITDDQALAFVVIRADIITATVGEIVRFFIMRQPRRVDIDPVAEAIAESERAHPYSTQNWLMGFAAERGLLEWRRSFEVRYGALDYSTFVGSIYEDLIGSDAARASGYDPAAAIEDTTRRYDGVLALLRREDMLGEDLAAADEDLAVKAATVGYLIVEGIKWDFGAAARRAEDDALRIINGSRSSASKPQAAASSRRKRKPG